jgi:hypothetical protein
VANSVRNFISAYVDEYFNGGDQMKYALAFLICFAASLVVGALIGKFGSKNDDE